MPDVSRQHVVDALTNALERAIARASHDLRALLIAAEYGGGSVAIGRLSVRLLAELDAFEFGAGWKFGRKPVTLGDLDDVIAAGMKTAGGAAMADAAAGAIHACRKLAEAIDGEFAMRGIVMSRRDEAAVDEAA